jgi:hypothetical protein
MGEHSDWLPPPPPQARYTILIERYGALGIFEKAVRWSDLTPEEVHDHVEKQLRTMPPQDRAEITLTSEGWQPERS